MNESGVVKKKITTKKKTRLFRKRWKIDNSIKMYMVCRCVNV